MTKREIIFNKFGGRCAYSGTILEPDWQIEHIVPKSIAIQSYDSLKAINDISNLVPVQKIINHYKRSLTLSQFRNWYLADLHKRLRKLPKNPIVKRSQRHKEYMLKVAAYFDISPEKPFTGKFYFETLTEQQ
jgi:hypothetical protein